MTTAWLCQIDAFARVGGAATTVRLASHDDDRLCHLNGQTWWPAIARLPTLAYDFFDGAFGGEIVTPSGRADLSIEAVPGFAALMLHGARIRWYSGALGAVWGDYALRFDGLIDNHPAIRDGVAAVDFRVDDRWLDDPILSTYAGTTGAEGEAAQKGQVKPLLLGAPRFVEGVMIDTIDTIVQLNDGAIAGVDVGFESVARFAASAGDYPNFAALDAATIAPGFYATCLALGYVRHGAPPDGVLTYHVQGSNAGGDGGGQVRRAGAMIKRIAARLGHAAKVDAAGLTAIDSARPWNLSVALTSQTTLRELAQSLAQSINAVALVTWTGLLTMLPIDPPESATAIGTLASDGTALPPVARVDQLGIAPPWWRTAIEAEVTHRVHGYDEVRFTANLVEVGIYDSGTTYREGNIASIADGSRWLYTSATPTAGNAPSDASSFWSRLSAAATGPAGADGVSPPLIKLTATHQTFRYDTTDAAMTQTTTLTATRQNTAGTTEWQLRAIGGAVLASWRTAASMVTVGGASTAPDNDTLTLTQAQFQTIISGNGTTGLIYESRISTATGVQDRASITKIRDGAAGAPGSAGAPGANGTNGITLYTWYAYANHPAGLFDFTTGDPGGRFYQGIAYNKTTATESTNPADYAWAPYEGPPNFGLAITANAILAGSKLISTSAVAGWNGAIHSTESFKGGASVSFVVDAGPHSFMVGLNTDPTTDASYVSLDFAIYIAGTTLQVYQSNSVAFSQTGFVALNDTFSVTYNGKSVVYSKNGAPFFTNNSPTPDLALFLDTSFNSGGVYMGRILSFTAVGKPGDDGSDGTDGVDGRSMELAKPVLQILADYDGTIKSGQLPVTCKATFVSGGTDVSASTSWGRTDNNTTSSIGSTGLLTITAVSGNGYVDVSGVYGGTTIVKRVAVEIVKDTAPPQSGTSITTSNIGGNIGTTTMPTAPTSNVVTMGTDASGSLQGVLASRYQVTEAAYSAGRAVTMKGQLFYRLAGSGGAWSTFSGGVVTGGSSGATWTIPDGELNKVEGELNINQSQTGLSANTNYEVGCAIVKDSGSGTALDYIFGTLTVNQL